jgi:crotonobetainyl-CoA:carnitine CoA-transferase CaiB-like acyl-CoA transferase
MFNVDGVANPAGRGVPRLGEHTAEVLAEVADAQRLLA